MKKILFTIILLLTAFMVAGQGLNKEAEMLKNASDTELYESIKKRALNKWGSDYDMVVFEINKQAKSLLKFYQEMQKWEEDSPEYEILIRAYQKWGEDYDMVVYEYTKQLKNYKRL